jgi:hypothetical protein
MIGPAWTKPGGTYVNTATMTAIAKERLFGLQQTHSEWMEKVDAAAEQHQLLIKKADTVQVEVDYWMAVVAVAEEIDKRLADGESVAVKGE